MLSWRKKTSELPVRSWQIYDERPIEKLDERPVIAEYVENERCYPDDINELWVSQYCRISQYMLQIVKVNDSYCCCEI